MFQICICIGIILLHFSVHFSKKTSTLHVCSLATLLETPGIYLFVDVHVFVYVQFKGCPQNVPICGPIEMPKME